MVVCKVVTPCVGVWIEIICLRRIRLAAAVTPCVGVWIEISAGLSIVDTGK